MTDRARDRQTERGREREGERGGERERETCKADSLKTCWDLQAGADEYLWAKDGREKEKKKKQKEKTNGKENTMRTLSLASWCIIYIRKVYRIIDTFTGQTSSQWLSPAHRLTLWQNVVLGKDKNNKKRRERASEREKERERENRLSSVSCTRLKKKWCVCVCVCK